MNNYQNKKTTATSLFYNFNPLRCQYVTQRIEYLLQAVIVYNCNYKHGNEVTIDH